MLRKLTIEHIDAVYKAASDNNLESVQIFKNLQGRNKGAFMIDYKITPDILPGYIDTALHDTFKQQLMELRKAVETNILTDIDVSYIVTAKHMKLNIRTKQ